MKIMVSYKVHQCGFFLSSSEELSKHVTIVVQMSKTKIRIFQIISLGKSARFAYIQGLVRFCVCVSVSVCLSVKIIRISHTLAKIKNVRNVFCRL